MDNQDIKQIVEKWEERTFRMHKTCVITVSVIAIAILVSLIAIVIMQFCSNNPSYELAAEICNTYTSIILGFVAMAVSIISIILSFYNTIQAEKSNIESLKQFTQMTNLSQKTLAELDPISDSLKLLPSVIDSQLQINSTIKEIQTTLDSIKNTTQPNNGIVAGQAKAAPEEGLDDAAPNTTD